jgi:hypothetical protein
MTIRHDRSSDRSPLHDVRKHVLQASWAHKHELIKLPDEHLLKRAAPMQCHLGNAIVAMATSLNPTGGARRDRTDDLLLAKQALSQLSYGPFPGSVISDGLGGPGKT